MNFPACLTLPNAENLFLGVPLAQTWQDLALWEAFLERYPCASILELGTWRGGMALFLALQARWRGAEFATLDLHQGGLVGRERLEETGARVLEADLFSFEGQAVVQRLVRELPKPLLLFCDDGDKPREWRTFVPLLSPGDRVAVHDWDAEFRLEDCDPPLPMVLPGECESVRSLTRFFLVP
jgi:cephalosporin hydroxylase